MTELRHARALIAFALIAAALVLGGCGGDDEDATTSPSPAAAPNGGATPPNGSATPNLSNLPPAFLECLVDQGVDIESEADVSAALHSPGGNQCFEALHGG